MFIQDGFLSEEYEAPLTALRKNNIGWFELVNVCNRLAMDILSHIKPPIEDNQKLLSAGFYGRAVQSFQAIILLIARGMTSDARTVLRSMAETVIIHRKIAKDHSFIDRLTERHQYHRRKFANALLRDEQAGSALHPEQFVKLRNVIQEIDAEYPDTKPKDIRLEQVAIDVDGISIYNLIIRPTSGDAAHVNLDALMRHMVTDSAGNISGLRFGPDLSDLADTLSLTVSVLLNTLDTVVEDFQLETFCDRLTACLTTWKTLTEATNSPAS